MITLWEEGKGKIIEENVRMYGWHPLVPISGSRFGRNDGSSFIRDTRRTEYAICTFCVKQEDWNSVELNYGARRSTMNLIYYLDTELRPGHRD